MSILCLAAALVAGCTYPSKSQQGQLITLSGVDCIDKQGKLVRKVRKDLDYSGDRLSWFTTYEPFAVHYVRRDGVFKQTHWFDNGPDYFDSGMVRLIQAGKYGFMDSSLKVVIPPGWDFAYPFEGGLAQVGNECKTIREDPEHSSIACSQWFRIDRQGRVASDSTPP